MTVYGNYDVITFRSCIQIFTVYIMQQNIIDSCTIFDKTDHREEQSWEADEPKSQTTFPVGAILILLSFTLMLFLEQTCAKSSHADITQNEKIPIIILTKV